MSTKQVAKIGAISEAGAVIAIAASQSMAIAFAIMTLGVSGLVVKSYQRVTGH